MDRALVDFELGIDKLGKCPAPGQRKIYKCPVVARGGPGRGWNWLKCFKIKARIKAAREKEAVQVIDFVVY